MMYWIHDIFIFLPLPGCSVRPAMLTDQCYRRLIVLSESYLPSDLRAAIMDESLCNGSTLWATASPIAACLIRTLYCIWLRLYTYYFLLTERSYGKSQQKQKRGSTEDVSP